MVVVRTITINRALRSRRRYAMRDLDFSKNNLPAQWQYVKRNLGELGVLYQFDDFESQAHRSIQELMQSCVNEEFALQVRAGRY